MKRVAVFGKPGGGKSTLSKKLAASTGIRLYPLDLIEYKKNGERVPLDRYLEEHDKLIGSDSWIIEGLGTLDSFWDRVSAADTLIYVDLPYWLHYWLVTKRFLVSPIVKPEGWPEGSSILKGTLASWKYLRLSPRFWTSDFFDKIKHVAVKKSVYRLTSIKDLNLFIENHVAE